jgi:hypothetical protein
LRWIFGFMAERYSTEPSGLARFGAPTCIFSTAKGLRTCRGVARRAKTDDVLGQALQACPAVAGEARRRILTLVG